MCAEIYENVDVTSDERFNSENDNNFYEDIYAYEDKLQTTRGDRNKNSGCVTAGCYRWTTVGLLLLCVLLLAVIVMLTVKNDHLQTSNKNLSIEKDQLQTSYNDLTIKKDQLQRFCLDQGWVYFQSSVYTRTTEPKGWMESRENCIKKGADLVVIKSKEEQMFIRSSFPRIRAWIGANDIDHEGLFLWVDGTTLNSGFWKRGEPNNYGGNENCVVISNTDSPLNSWNDATCDNPHVGICEKRL